MVALLEPPWTVPETVRTKSPSEDDPVWTVSVPVPGSGKKDGVNEASEGKPETDSPIDEGAPNDPATRLVVTA